MVAPKEMVEGSGLYFTICHYFLCSKRAVTFLVLVRSLCRNCVASWENEEGNGRCLSDWKSQQMFLLEYLCEISSPVSGNTGKRAKWCKNIVSRSFCVFVKSVFDLVWNIYDIFIYLPPLQRQNWIVLSSIFFLI